jgi:subtilisin family serine protease
MKNRIRVLNLSIGRTTPDPIEASYMEKLEAAGIVVVASAGNTPPDTDRQPVMYPALYPTVISVAAFAWEGHAAWPRSNWDFPVDYNGDRDFSIDVAAPGEWIVTTLPNGYNRFDMPFSAWLHGTSMAAPYVTAAVAVLCHKDRDRQQSPAQIREELYRHLPSEENTGAEEGRGLLNCEHIRL